MRFGRLKSLSGLVSAERQGRGRLSWTLSSGILFLGAGFVGLVAILGGSVSLHVPPDIPWFLCFLDKASTRVEMLENIPPTIPTPSFGRYALLSVATCIGFITGYIQSKKVSSEMEGLSRRNWWNWSAFFFTWLWYLFKGIRKRGLVLLLIVILVTILPRAISWRIEDYLTGPIALDPFGTVRNTAEQLVERIQGLEDLGTTLLRLKAFSDLFQVFGALWIVIHCGRNAEIDFYRKFGVLNKEKLSREKNDVNKASRPVG